MSDEIKKITIKYRCPKCDTPGEVSLVAADLDAGGKDFVCKGCDFANAVYLTSKPKPGLNGQVFLESAEDHGKRD